MRQWVADLDLGHIKLLIKTNIYLLNKEFPFFGQEIYCFSKSALYTNTTTVMCPILNVRETCLSVDASESYEETCHKAQ